jgi:hypothetical protein
MFNRIWIVFSLFIAVVALHGCGGPPEYYPSDEPLDEKELIEAAERGEAARILGAPRIVEEWNGLRFEGYDVYKGVSIIKYLWPPVPPFPIPEYYYVTIAYDSEGSMLGVRTWPEAGSPEEAIELHKKSLQKV